MAKSAGTTNTQVDNIAGTFTFTDTAITFTGTSPASQVGVIWVMPYTLNGYILNIEPAGKGLPGGNFGSFIRTFP
jgi:hypothetical protein